LIQEKLTMTELALRREHTNHSGAAAVLQLLKEAFAATPLGIVLKAIGER
jgi:hypothetical protein